MEQLTAAQQAAELNKKNLFATYNHIEAEFVEPDHAIFKLEIRPESKNPYGIVHGGAIYTMADNATGYAAHTDGRSYVTQGSSMHFLRNQSEGVVRADAKVRHRGRTTCLVNVDILGDGGKLLATGEFTYFCMAPDTMATTQHIEFRYGSDLDALGKYDAGEYAYWLASGISVDCTQEDIENCIQLFCTENLSA